MFLLVVWMFELLSCWMLLLLSLFWFLKLFWLFSVFLLMLLLLLILLLLLLLFWFCLFILLVIMFMLDILKCLIIRKLIGIDFVFSWEGIIWIIFFFKNMFNGYIFEIMVNIFFNVIFLSVKLICFDMVGWMVIL